MRLQQSIMMRMKRERGKELRVDLHSFNGMWTCWYEEFSKQKWNGSKTTFRIKQTETENHVS